ncbi:MAG: nitroreductase [Chloroflexi bacterium]|nr:nitroreductase [Chloroflexota bacterium]
MSSNPVIEAIQSRRTVREYTDRSISRDQLTSWLEAACWAPNHRLTEPWRFIVLEHGGAKRREVAEMCRDHAFDTSDQLPEPKRSDTADAARDEVLSAPAFVYAYSLAGDNEVAKKENYAASACAVQNLSLAAHADGFAVGWSTGRATLLSGLASTIGADESWQMVGILFIGEPERIPRAQRQPMEEVVTWL